MGAIRYFVMVRLGNGGGRLCEDKAVEGFRGVLRLQQWGNTAPIWATRDTVSVLYQLRAQASSPTRTSPVLLP